MNSTQNQIRTFRPKVLSVARKIQSNVEPPATVRVRLFWFRCNAAHFKKQTDCEEKPNEPMKFSQGESTHKMLAYTGNVLTHTTMCSYSVRPCCVSDLHWLAPRAWRTVDWAREREFLWEHIADRWVTQRAALWQRHQYHRMRLSNVFFIQKEHASNASRRANMLLFDCRYVVVWIWFCANSWCDGAVSQITRGIFMIWLLQSLTDKPNGAADFFSAVSRFENSISCNARTRTTSNCRDSGVFHLVEAPYAKMKTTFAVQSVYWKFSE